MYGESNTTKAAATRVWRNISKEGSDTIKVVAARTTCNWNGANSTIKAAASDTWNRGRAQAHATKPDRAGEHDTRPDETGEHATEPGEAHGTKPGEAGDVTPRPARHMTSSPARQGNTTQARRGSLM